ncbi:AMMECR1 domain-containing protein [Candidatus Gracilibacteria bacterium 28_42_T64]|nr:AMMECR1 domain-containing protein [Candidatus Gracilibacteria bacterium 28_42_T64]
MLNIISQTMEFYTKYKKVPSLSDIKIENSSLLEGKTSLFITLYKNGEIRGSAGNIREITSSTAEELIQNTIHAISKDHRFPEIKIDDVKDLKIRLDVITNRRVIQDNELTKIDPVKNGVLAIKKDYSKLAVILPNIHPTLLTGDDFAPILKEKLGEKYFKANEYIVYEIQTEVSRDF